MTTFTSSQNYPPRQENTQLQDGEDEVERVDNLIRWYDRLNEVADQGYYLDVRLKCMTFSQLKIIFHLLQFHFRRMETKSVCSVTRDSMILSIHLSLIHCLKIPNFMGVFITLVM